MLHAPWSPKKELKKMHAMRVVCLDCSHEDTINSDDKEWRCHKCKRLWKVADLIWNRR